MKVKDVMHKGVDWVSPNTPVTELAKLMRGHDIGCIPIGEDDRLIGMVTDRDIVCKGLASNNFDAGRATARDVMTEGIHCCREDDDLAKAMHHMEKLQLRRLPVINKSKRMTGMLSLGDVSHSASGDLLSECYGWRSFAIAAKPHHLGEYGFLCAVFDEDVQKFGAKLYRNAEKRRWPEYGLSQRSRPGLASFRTISGN